MHSITYSKNNEIVTIEWITPTGWDAETIIQSFHRQYPQADLIRIEALL